MYIFICKRTPEPEDDLYINSTGSNPKFTKSPKIWKSYVAVQTFIRNVFFNTNTDLKYNSAVWRKEKNIFIKDNSRILGYKIDLDKPDINLSLEEFQKIKIPKES